MAGSALFLYLPDLSGRGTARGDACVGEMWWWGFLLTYNPDV